MSKGQFLVSFDGIHHQIQGIDVDAAELYTALDPESKKYAIVACATLYLHSMNGMVTVLGGGQAEYANLNPALPARELLDTSAVEFVSLVASHKAQFVSVPSHPVPSHPVPSHPIGLGRVYIRRARVRFLLSTVVN
jgi:hypothetical protein